MPPQGCRFANMPDNLHGMTDEPKVSKRPPNPGCGNDNCHHPKSFHRYSRTAHRSPCSAFGCKCKDYRKKETA